MASQSLLLVENNPRIRALLRLSLENLGFAVSVAESGHAALRLIADRADRFDALISDIRLGDDVSGWDVARSARANDDGIAVLYMSGDSGDAWESQGVPGSRFLAKPFGIRAIPEALATLLVSQG